MNGDWSRRSRVALVCFAVLVIASPSLLDALPATHHDEAASTQLVFFGTSQTLVLAGDSVVLSLNLTNVDPTPISTIIHAVVDNESNNQTLETVNSSAATLQPSIPTIVNETIDNLAACINYSIAVDVVSTIGAILANKGNLYFPVRGLRTGIDPRCTLEDGFIMRRGLHQRDFHKRSELHSHSSGFRRLSKPGWTDSGC